MISWVEPPHVKTSKMTMRPARTQINLPSLNRVTQISLGIFPVWSESSLSAWRKLGSSATHWAHSEDWSDWADAQADLSLRWTHTHFVGFVMRRLNWLMSSMSSFFKIAKQLLKAAADFHCFKLQGSPFIMLCLGPIKHTVKFLNIWKPEFFY